MSWFSELSKAQQAEYIKKHPGSKYAKGSAGKGRARKTEQEKQTAYMNRMLKRENKYWNARQLPHDPTR